MRPPQRSQVWWGVGSAASPTAASVLTLTSRPLPRPPPTAQLSAGCCFTVPCLTVPCRPPLLSCLPPPALTPPASCPPSGAQRGSRFQLCPLHVHLCPPAPAFLPLLLHLPFSYSPLTRSLLLLAPPFVDIFLGFFRPPRLFHLIRFPQHLSPQVILFSVVLSCLSFLAFLTLAPLCFCFL